MVINFIDYYLLCSIGYRCPENYNSADFIMKILSDNNKLTVNSVCDEFAASKYAELVKNAISNEIYFVSIVDIVYTFRIKDLHCYIIYVWLNNRISIEIIIFRRHQVYQ